MPSFDCFLFLTFLCLLSDAASSSPSSHSNGIVAFSLFNRLSPHSEHIGKRSSDDFSINLANKLVWYGISLEIGTPGQQVELQIDTGSSDLWVSSFDSSKSSTFHLNSSDPFSITYGDGTGVQGNFCQDTIAISGTDVLLKDANFAYAPDTSTTPQVCGIGLAENESSNNIYQNLPAQLKAQGQIAANVYSIYMGSSSQDGRIIFGGVDHSKYSGKLQKVPLKSDHQFIISLDSVSYNKQTLSSSSVDALLDSGTTVMLLPSDLVTSMVQTIDPFHDDLVVDCSKLNSDNSFQFTFSGAVIDVPFRNLIDSRSANQDGSIPTSGQCSVGFQPSSGTVILGDRFLMGAYVVFDLENKEIALANLDASSSSGGIEAVTAGGAIPGAVNAPQYGGGSGQSPPPPSSSSTSSSSSSSSSSPSSSSTNSQPSSSSKSSSTSQSTGSSQKSTLVSSTNHSIGSTNALKVATVNVTTIITDGVPTASTGPASSSDDNTEYVTLYEPETVPVRHHEAQFTTTKLIQNKAKRANNSGTVNAPAVLVSLCFAAAALFL